MQRRSIGSRNHIDILRRGYIDTINILSASVEVRGSYCYYPICNLLRLDFVAIDDCDRARANLIRYTIDRVEMSVTKVRKRAETIVITLLSASRKAFNVRRQWGAIFRGQCARIPTGRI